MKENKRLFYDTLVEYYRRNDLTNAYEAAHKRKGSNPDNSVIDLIKEKNATTLRVLETSALFFINGAVADDLLHVPHDPNYQSTFHLPFPVLFFEFMKPLEVEIIENRNLRGVVYGKASDANFLAGKVDDDFKYPDDQFAVGLFYDTPIPDMVYFRVSALPNLAFLTNEGFFYEYTPDTGVVATLNETQGTLYQQSLPHDPEILRKNFQNLVNLSVNLIDYINAHNVTIRKVERTPVDIDRINRKRQRKGKKMLMPLKPYYWTDVEQSEQREQVVRPTGDTQNYREWLRGHFQRYHTSAGIAKNWIMPYVRGPEDTPWKEKRYRVLDDMLKEGHEPT
ncbi:MAG: hypothetical protein Q7K45_02915 [Nanoarchaeota archaeon]|nr:hypothetical protein [Nanoarchaeota archaeon]